MNRLTVALGLAAALAALPLAAQDHPIPPGDASHHMTLPAGFKATLFAGEPDLVQPIAFTFDDRGRLWVVESYSYPHWTKEKEGRDRVLIFEDTDGDGRFDKRTVFWDKGANLSGIQLGFGGVWLCATPNLLFLPVRAGADRPAGPPEVVLDGWDLEAKHNVFNGLTWGPDGWLYGCNGISSNSRVGKPGTPDQDRTPLNCGVWRYHPTRKVFEVVAWGTTNPWGLDFDDSGEMFITNCVIDHLWHVIPGAHYERMFGQDLNPHVFQLMKSCCDHIHWAGGPWQASRGNLPEHSDFGGGHAHAGCMVYLGDNWPQEYRNDVFMCNIHGKRVNRDRLERRGSGYVAHHGRDFLFANDPWFRGLALQYGPDGGVYVSDWCDTGECHNAEVVDQTNGRIFKVVYGTPKPWHGDLAKLSDAELVKLQLHKNDWFVRHSRRLLQERAAAGRLDPATRGQLERLLRDQPDETRKLRALWALHVTGGLDEKRQLELLGHGAEHVRAWAVRLALEGVPPLAVLEQFTDMAKDDQSSVVRLALASGMQRMPRGMRDLVGVRLASRAADADDPNLPLMIWYGLEPVVLSDSMGTARVLARPQIPLVREYVARRLAGHAAVYVDYLVYALGDESERPDVQRDWLRGMRAAFRGRRDVPLPNRWPATFDRLATSPSAEVRELATALAVVFGDERVMASLRATVQDEAAPAAKRQSALQLLTDKRPPGLIPLLHGLVTDPALRGPAVRALAAYNDPATPALILKHYADFTGAEKADAVATLASRPAFALALLDAIEKGAVPQHDVSAFTVRQLQGLKDPEIRARLARVWGTARPSSKEKRELILRYKGLLAPDYLKSADLPHGRQLFAKHCATCHRLFDDGARIGPELTGSQRANLDYVLENVIDPSAVVAKEYQVTRFVLKSGRVIDGVVPQEDGRAVTVQTPTERLVVPKDEIEAREPLKVSLMPEGLLEQLSREEARDLVTYLASPAQVPPPTK
jgi:putative membrane-bound dehydrogenase-like protein